MRQSLEPPSEHERGTVFAAEYKRWYGSHPPPL